MYVTSAALDFGAVVGSILVYVMFQANVYYQIKLPYGPWNPVDNEGCAPDYFLTCAGNADYGSAFNRTYNIEDDPYCSSINFGTASGTLKS
jgi:hypothetical protein